MIGAPKRIARALLCFVPAWALALLALWLPTSAALIALLLALPAALLAAARILDRQPASPSLARLAIRGAGALTLVIGYCLVVAALLGIPTAMALREATPLAAIALSAGVVLAVLCLWRWWPAFGLIVADDAVHLGVADASRIAGGVRRALTAASVLSRRADPYFNLGLSVALALLTLIGGALALAGAHNVLAGELRLIAGVLWAVVLLPLASLWVVHGALRVARAQDRADPPVELAPDEIAEPMLLPTDPGERNQALLQAAAAHDTERALALLRAGADPHTTPWVADRDQRSALMIAATAADTRLLRELIKRGADLNRTHAGLTPLLVATRDSYAGRIEAVQTLLTNGARLDARDAEDNTALHHAARTRDPIICAMLLDAGADPALLNRQALSAIGVACQAGNLEVVRLLIERMRTAEVPGAVPLLIAAAQARDEPVELVKRLLRAKASVAARDALGRSALHVAALHGHAAVASALLAAGAPVDALDARGVTALMDAARAGADAVIAALKSARPDPARVDSDGRNALLIAVGAPSASESTIAALLALGVDPRTPSAQGRSAVDEAVAAGRWQLVAKLDPAFALPSAISSAELLPDIEAGSANRIELLGAALRHGRLDIADALLSLTPALGPDEWLNVTATLNLAPSPASAWWAAKLAAAGLIERHGTCLLVAALSVRPANPELLRALVAAGAVLGGVRIAELLAATDPARRDVFEALALDFLERGADPFAADANAMPALRWATRWGMCDLAEALLARGLDPNGADASGQGPLLDLLAHREDQAERALIPLLRAGADPQRRACDGRTPLGIALSQGRRDLAEWFDWPGPYQLPGRPLRADDVVAAAALGDARALERLYALGFALDTADPQGATALIRAAGRGHAHVVRWLLDLGADPQRATAAGVDALAAAIRARHADIVATLLDRGVALTRRLPGGATDLMLAAAIGAPEIVELLLLRGADAQAASDKGERALHAAARVGFAASDPELALRQLRTLLAADPEIDAANAAGQTPLLLLLGADVQPDGVHSTRPRGDPRHIAMVELLLAAGVDLAGQDTRGVGVLHAAAIHGETAIAQLLLRAGAPNDARDRLNRSPGELALMLGYADLAFELKRGPRQSP